MLDKIFAVLEKFTPPKLRWILNHEGFRRYFANTGWMFFGQMFSLLIAFFIGAWIARYLGPQNFGVLSFSMSFAGLFLFLASLGIDGVLTRELVKFPEKQNELMGTSLGLKLIGGSLAFILSACAAFLFGHNNLIRMLIILFALTFILQASSVITLFFQAKVLAKKVIKVQLISMAISSVLKVLAILSGMSVFWIMLVYVLDTIWMGFGLVIAYRQFGLKIRNWTINWSLARSIFKDSWPLMLSGAAISIYMKIDQVMIGNILGEKQVGLYAAAVKISEIWYFIPVLICASVFPAIVNAKNDPPLYKRRLHNLYWLMFILAASLAVPISILARPLVRIIFGQGYLPAAGALQIHIWAGIGIFLAVALSQYLLSENLNIINFVMTLSSAVLNIILNLFLIKSWGINGAAFATLISYLSIPVTFLIYTSIRKRVLKHAG
ncbi:MAG: flippase [Ignavibacteriaceae bacterium]|nr:flippase [Ignavibacteriaceae bacterium]